MAKRIGLITIHHSYNFGAMLQCYATIYKLRKADYDVEVINYDSKTFKESRRLFTPIKSAKDILRNLRNLSVARKIKRRNKRFEVFYSKFPLSAEYYYESIKSANGKYDAVLTGSDQTFCLRLTRTAEEMKPFFQYEIDNTQLKISYASSMGEKGFNLNDYEIEWIKDSLSDFDSLLVREDKTAQFIGELVGKDINVVVDPTLLLDEKEWNEAAGDISTSGNYILFYTVLSDKWVVDYAKQLSKAMKLPVIALHNKTRYDLFSGFKYIYDCGPAEFLSYVKNASYVVTTSFHGTAFSLIYKKQFKSLIVGNGNRIKSLLESLGLSSCCCNSDNLANVGKFDNQIDYKMVNIKLESLKKKSLNCLLKSLKNEQ